MVWFSGSISSHVTTLLSPCREICLLDATSGWLYYDSTPTPLLFIMKHVLKQNLQAGSNQTPTSAEKSIKRNRKKAHRIPMESKPRRGRQPKKAWWSDRRDKRRTADFSPPLFQGATRWQSLFASEEEANGVGTSAESFSVNEMRISRTLPTFCRLRIVAHRACARHE